MDSDAEDINETAFAVKEVLSVHHGSRLQMGGRTSLSVGGEMKRGHSALFNWREGAEDYASFLWIMPLDKRFMKIRATYVRPRGSEGEAMTSTLNAVKAIADQVCR
ncbi:hypothetical protein HNO84_19980 [Herbaspirillum robiniae]|uniref:Uncharacterized protein n=1 Tax=Herbaspirillum robiniae TaxID=2014887 RepID=A0ABX2M3E0_9BURK|nr:hypothetical protein [Herbaspirillum robiniae]